MKIASGFGGIVKTNPWEDSILTAAAKDARNLFATPIAIVIFRHIDTTNT